MEQPEVHINNDEGSEGIVRHEEELLMHRERPKTDMEAQIVLAEELYMRDHPGMHDLSQKDTRNEIMLHWMSKGYSSIFQKLRLHPRFLKHARYAGDFAAITLADLDRYVGDPSLIDSELS